MTAIEFVLKLQKYYGLKYPEGQQPDIKNYLSRLSEEYLDELYLAVLRLHSSTWGNIPDIAIFEKARPEVLSIVNQRDENNNYKQKMEEYRSQAVECDPYFAEILKKMETKVYRRQHDRF